MNTFLSVARVHFRCSIPANDGDSFEEMDEESRNFGKTTKEAEKREEKATTRKTKKEWRQGVAEELVVWFVGNTTIRITCVGRF